MPTTTTANIPTPTPVAGLSSAEALRRLREVGPNELARAPGASHVRRFLAQLVHLFALLLWAGAALAFVAGMPQLAAAIVVVVFVNAVFAFAQEYRAERAADALRQMLPQRARVRRDGTVTDVPAAELVPGDVIILEAGDRISVDADLVEVAQLRVDNSTLTGEPARARAPPCHEARRGVLRRHRQDVLPRRGCSPESRSRSPLPSH